MHGCLFADLARSGPATAGWAQRRGAGGLVQGREGMEHTPHASGRREVPDERSFHLGGGGSGASWGGDTSRSPHAAILRSQRMLLSSLEDITRERDELLHALAQAQSQARPARSATEAPSKSEVCGSVVEQFPRPGPHRLPRTAGGKPPPRGHRQAETRKPALATPRGCLHQQCRLWTRRSSRRGDAWR